MPRPTLLARRAAQLVASCLLSAVAAGVVGCRTPSDAPPESWGNIHSGIPRERLHKRLGPPSGKSSRGGDSWAANGWVLDVEYDQEGNVDASSQGHAPSRRPPATSPGGPSTSPHGK